MDKIESNIILQTVVPLPKGDGFSAVHRSLDKLTKKLEDLTNREWKVRVTIDDSELKKFGFRASTPGKKTPEERERERRDRQEREENKIWDQLRREDEARRKEKKRDAERQKAEDDRVWNQLVKEQKQIDARIERDRRAAERNNQPPAPPATMGQPDRPSFGVSERRIAGRPGEDGPVYTTTDIQERMQGFEYQRFSTTTNEAGEILRTDDKIVDTAQRRIVLQQKQRELQRQIAAEAAGPAQEEIRRLEQMGFMLDSIKTDRDLVFGTETRTPVYARASRDQQGNLRTEYTGVNLSTGKATDMERRGPSGEFAARKTASGQALLESEQRTKELNAQSELQKMLNQGFKVLESAGAKQGSDPFQQNSVKLYRMGQAQSGQETATIVNAALRGQGAGSFRSRELEGLQAVRFRKSLEDREASTQQATQRNQNYILQQLSQLRASGFQQMPSSRTFNKNTGQLEEVQNLRKVSGNVLRGFTVEMVRANVAAQELRTNLLTGANASRALGDSMALSIQKVALWSVATGSVFLFTRGLYEAAVATTELEQSSVLLARVGRGLGGEFEQRFESAKRLSRAILELNTAIGGNAQESLRASTVFARAGQDEKEILESVRVSLLAARIAELEVAEAAELMSSAIYQFEGSARDMAPTLDMLNTLSNSFRVTTGDLLQSISRSGSIIAQQNGQMSELAATTAITASVTSRSGAEIGNAIKTIASQIDRVETKRFLFEKLGVTVHDLGGESKSYTEFLLEMSLALQTATDAERNMATTQVAGVRQRNVLLAQMKNIVDIIKAENIALMGTGERDDVKYGSGIAELLQTSNTLESSLNRLQSQAMATASSLGGGFQELGKDISDVITMILRWISTGNEATSGMLTAIAIVGSLTIAMRIMAASYGITNASVLTFVKGLYAQIAATNLSTASMKALAASIWASAGAFIAVNAVFAAGAIAVYAITSAIAEYARISQIAAAIDQTRAEVADRDIVRQQNRAKAYENTTEKIVTMMLAIQRLREEEQKSGVNNQIAIRQIQKDAMSLSNQVGLDLSPTDDIESIQRKGAKLSLEAGKAEAESTQFLLKKALKDFDEFSGKVEAERQKIKAAESSLRFQEGKLSSLPSSTFGRNYVQEKEYGTAASAIARLKSEIIESTGNMEKYKGEVVKSDQEVLRLKIRLGELRSQHQAMTKDVVGYQNALIAVRDFEQRIERTQEKRSAAADVLSLMGISDLKVARMSYQAIAKDIYSVEGALLKLKQTQGVSEQGQAAKAERNLLKLREEQLKVAMKIYSIESKMRRDAAAATVSMDSKLRQGQSRIASELRRGMGTNSSLTDPLAAIDAEREAITRDTIAMQFQISSGNFNSQEEADEVKKKAAENINRLRDLEIERALSILEIEKNIAIERKKSADEALRAVGALSEEDKMRTLAQMQFFAQNPNAKFNAEDMFRMNSADASIMERFFPTKMSNLMQGSGSFGSIIGASRFGISRDLQMGQDEINKIRGGRTTEQIIADARANAAARGNQAGMINNGELSNRQPAGFTSGSITANINLNGNLDFTPIFNEVERLIDSKRQQQIAEISSVVQRIVDKKWDVVKPPRIDGR